MTRGTMWSFPPSLVSSPLPIFIIPRMLVKMFNHQYGNCTNQSEEMQGLMTLSAPSECHFYIVLWLLSKAHFMCVIPRVHYCVLCFQNNVHTAAYWTVVNQDRNTSVSKCLGCSVSANPARWYLGPKYLFHDLIDLGKCFIFCFLLDDSQCTFIYS